jgi:hypothetical protein
MIDFSRQGKTVTARFSSEEATIIQILTSQLVEMLVNRSDESITAEDPLAARMGIGSLTAPPPDPALARLLPNAYRDDDEAASDYRRFTEVSLVERKIANARAVALSVSATPSGLRRTVSIRLDDTGVQSWLRTLTDLRLVLADRLTITVDNQQPDNGAMTSVYDWLGYLQATLLEEWEVR